MTSTTRTPEEIQDLKTQWLRDGCWDIEDTEGFEAHREELLSWRKEQEAQWKQDREQALLARAQKNNVTPEVQAEADRWQARHDRSLETAQGTLVHTLGKHLPWDVQGELAGLLQDTAEAARAAVIRDLLLAGIIQPGVLK